MTDPVASPFEDPKPATVADPVAVAPAFQLPETVQGLVGEGKKYRTAEEALQSIPHAQSHIEKLEDEMASLRESVARSRNVEEVLEEIKKASTVTQDAPTDIPVPQVDASMVAQVVQNELQAEKAQEVAKINTNTVVSAMADHFGDATKADEAYRSKAQELGMNLQSLNQLTAESPEAVLTLFGLTKTTAPDTVRISSSINTEAMSTIPAAPEPLKSVMGASTHKDDVAAWNAAAPRE